MLGKRLWYLFLPIIVVQVFLAYFSDESGQLNMRRPPPERFAAIPPPRAEGRPGARLEKRSRFDPAFTVDVGEKSNSSGTAFSIRGEGVWLTARHVVDGCDRIGRPIRSQPSTTCRAVSQTPSPRMENAVPELLLFSPTSTVNAGSKRERFSRRAPGRPSARGGGIAANRSGGGRRIFSCPLSSLK